MNSTWCSVLRTDGSESFLQASTNQLWDLEKSLALAVAILSPEKQDIYLTYIILLMMF